jgi:hypothetical protein
MRGREWINLLQVLQEVDHEERQAINFAISIANMFTKASTGGIIRVLVAIFTDLSNYNLRKLYSAKTFSCSSESTAFGERGRER